jgi:hypothetical protein
MSNMLKYVLYLKLNLFEKHCHLLLCCKSVVVQPLCCVVQSGAVQNKFIFVVIILAIGVFTCIHTYKLMCFAYISNSTVKKIIFRLCKN